MKTVGIEEIRGGDSGVAYTLDSAPPPPTRMEFDEMVDGDEVLVAVEVNEAALTSDLSNLGANISISLKSDVLGPEPSSDQLSLALFHAHAYFSYNAATYASILQCSAIPAVSILSSGLSASLSTLGSLLPNLPAHYSTLPLIPNNDSYTIPIFAAAKKRYRPVHRRTVPVPTTLPEEFRVIRQFPTDPLEHIPQLNPVPPSYVPTGRYTQERKEIIDRMHDQSFLWPEELKAVII